jgi:hypothetical protein
VRFIQAKKDGNDEGADAVADAVAVSRWERKGLEVLSVRARCVDEDMEDEVKGGWVALD